MKINIHQFLITFIIGFSLITPQAIKAEQRVLTVAWEQWEPFAYKDQHSNLVGLNVEIIKTIFEPQGFTVEFIEMPWARALSFFKHGKIDLLHSVMKTVEREQFARFSAPYQKETYLLYVPKDKATSYAITQLKDIAEQFLYIGVQRNYLYGEEYDRLIKLPEFKKHIEEVTTNQQNHEKLLAGRIDGFIQEASRVTTMGKSSGISEKVTPIFTVDTNKLHMVFSKASTSNELVENFNEGLQRIMADGTYQKLFKKYDLQHHNMLSN